jgi:hypothetical protein
MKKLSIFTLFSLCFSLAQADGMPEATLAVQSEVHENACTKKGLKKLKKALLALKVASPDTAWRDVEMLLCGRMTKGNIKDAIGLLLPEVEMSDELQEGQAPFKVKSSAVEPGQIFALKYAYGVNINKLHNSLEIGYYTNSACIARKTLQYTKDGWRIASLMYACD